MSRATAGLHTPVCVCVSVSVCGLYLGHIPCLIHSSAGERSLAAQAYPSLCNTGTQRADDSFRAEHAPMNYLCITLFKGSRSDAAFIKKKTKHNKKTCGVFCAPAFRALNRRPHSKFIPSRKNARGFFFPFIFLQHALPHIKYL